MKTIIDSTRYKLPLLAFSILVSICAFAQDGTTTTSETHTSTSNANVTNAPDPAAWYMAPWVWVAGVVLLIIILWAVFRGNSTSKSQVSRTYTTTTEVKND